MEKTDYRKMAAFIKNYLPILLGSILYAVSTVIFILPNTLLLGGTSGISVILESFLPFSSGSILVAINSALIISAFAMLGKNAAIKTLVGSILTTVFIGILENLFPLEKAIVSNPYVAAVVGASIIAVASGILFYVDSSSGGTDIIALIVKKFFHMNIGKAVLITDILIVLIGGALSETAILISSLLGFLIKTFGIDIIISLIEKIQTKRQRVVGGEQDTASSK